MWGILVCKRKKKVSILTALSVLFTDVFKFLMLGHRPAGPPALASPQNVTLPLPVSVLGSPPHLKGGICFIKCFAFEMINSACSFYIIFRGFLWDLTSCQRSSALVKRGWVRKGRWWWRSVAVVWGEGGGAEGCSESTNTFLYSLWCTAQLPACCSFGQSSLVAPSCAHRWAEYAR